MSRPTEVGSTGSKGNAGSARSKKHRCRLAKSEGEPHPHHLRYAAGVADQMTHEGGCYGLRPSRQACRGATRRSGKKSDWRKNLEPIAHSVRALPCQNEIAPQGAMASTNKCLAQMNF